VKFALLVLALLGGVWGARSLSGESGPWDGADSHTTFFDDGTPRSRTTLVEGRFEGPARTWHADGGLESEGEYADGEREGNWRFWRADGALDAQRSGRYASGRRVGPLPD
jgi:antitoxin component YwqK of YwqJK toxin-antitoxin module